MRGLLILAAVVAFTLATTWQPVRVAQAANFSFAESVLDLPPAVEQDFEKPTSIQWGPDDRLYVSQQEEHMWAFDVVQNGPNDYVVTGWEQINLVYQYTPNHNDDGSVFAQAGRQVTGILVTGTASNPVIYVTSSDFREGAGEQSGDSGLDTNSGVIHRLTWTGTEWDKVDLIRGLPRSEENHSLNGMQISPDGNTLYVTVGGNTNAGAPSNNFAFHTEYALANAVIAVDLTIINSLPVNEDATLYAGDGYVYKWVYDMPTLDDPERPNVGGITDPTNPSYTGEDVGDPFGGNDGLNQSIYDPDDPGYPIEIVSVGYRNIYDIVLTENGRMYGVDNGANQGWGGHPLGEIDYPFEYPSYPGSLPTMGQCTNEYDPAEPGSSGPGTGGDYQVDNQNPLHYMRPLVSGDPNYAAGSTETTMYYGGHPNPIRGNPAGAGLYTYDDDTDTGVWRTTIWDGVSTYDGTQLPVDWPPFPVSEANPAECDFRNPDDLTADTADSTISNALAAWFVSTNGITEYTYDAVFNGEMAGSLVMSGYGGNIFNVLLNADGDEALNCPTESVADPDPVGAPAGQEGYKNFCALLANNVGEGNDPITLDVTAVGSDGLFPGTLWIAQYGIKGFTDATSPPSILILEPEDLGDCDPADTSDSDDFDNDGYTNFDESQNGTNVCSGADQPSDNDDAFEHGASNQFKRSDLLDLDDDNDTVADLVDPFAIDVNNGTNLNVPLDWDLFNDDPGTFLFGLGFSGLMTNGTDEYRDLYPAKVTAGGAIGVLGVTAVSDGDATGATNNQEYAFQFGLNSQADDPPYQVHIRMLGGFLGLTPQNGRSQGIYLGTGDQDNYIKLALSYTGGSAVIEVVQEIGGTPTTIATDNVGNGILDDNSLDFYFIIDPNSTQPTVQAAYSLAGSDTQVLVGSPINVTGDIADAILGNYQIGGVNMGLAVGVISTNGGTDTFAADWDFIKVKEVPSTAQALVQVETGAGDIDGTTFGSTAFNIENISTEGQTIEKITFDVSTAAIPDIYFDPNGDAGDTSTGGEFDAGSNESDVGTFAENFINAGSNGGFQGLEITFTDFGPGDDFDFGVDMDPISIDGVAPPGPNDSGSISGLELSGMTVTVEFDDGSTTIIHDVELFGIEGSLGGSENVARNALPEAPTVNVTALPTPAITNDPTQEVQISGPADTPVKLLILEGGMFLEGVGNAVDVDPFDINSVVNVQEISGSIGESGSVTFNVTLTDTDGTGTETGYNYIFAVTEDPDDGATSDLSNVAIVYYDENAQISSIDIVQQIDRLNTEGDIVTADINATGGASALTYSADNLPPGLTIDPSTGEITGTIGENGDAGSPYNVTITVTDGSDTNNMQFEWTVVDAAGSDYAYRVNNGDVAVTDTPIDWEADTLAAPSQYYTSTTNSTLNIGFAAPINEDEPGLGAEILYSARQSFFGPMEWEFPITETGYYQVNVYFFEPFSETPPGDRFFDIMLEGIVVADDLDLVGKYGRTNIAVRETYIVQVADGTLDLDVLFPAGAEPEPTQSALTSAIEVIALNRAPAVDIGDVTSKETQPVNLQVPATDAENTTLTYAATGLPPGLSINASTGVITGTVPFGDQGTYNVTISVTDEAVSGIPARTTEVDIIWTVDPANSAPEITPIGDQLSLPGEVVSLQVQATDPDNDVLTYEAEGLPPGLSIDSGTGLISGTVANDADGLYGVTVTVTDSGVPVQSTEDNFTWTVSTTNQPPEIEPINNLLSNEGDSIVLQVNAVDPEDGTLTYEATNLPDGLSINPATGFISGTIAAGTDGTVYDVTITVTDDGSPAASASVEFDWGIGDVNLAPQIEAIADQLSVIGSTVSLQVNATDANGDPITFSATNLPDGLAIDPNSGLIGGTIANDADGTYEVTVTASDAETSTDATFTWTVRVTNEAPQLSPVANRSNIVGDQVLFQANATDPEGDPLTFSAEGLPAGVGITADGVIFGQLTLAAVGENDVTITVTDGNLSDEVAFTWTVTEENLLANAGFESSLTPDDWVTVIDGNGDLRFGPTALADDDFMWVFVTGADVEVLVQPVDLVGSAGDEFTFLYRIGTLNVDSPYVAGARLVFVDAENNVSVVNCFNPEGYTVAALQDYSCTIEAPTDYVRVVVQMGYVDIAKGFIGFDNVVLRQN